MEIKGIEGMSMRDIQDEINKGGKFVIYTYVISLLVISFKRGSDIHFIKSNESKIGSGWPYLLISLFLGWWGIPWGPIYTFQSIYYAFAGNDVTQEVMQSIAVTNPTIPTDPTTVSSYGINAQNNPYPINNREYQE